MSNHISEWLNAYHDGELSGNRLHQVEAHLAECELCQKELESLDRLSNALHTVPAPEFTSAERFASQVNLRLPHKQAVISKNQIFNVGWWMIPVGLLGIWVFMSTAVFVSEILSAANSVGLLSNISGWLTFGSSSSASWTAALGQFGVLSGNSLNWAESTETFTRTFLPFIILNVSIALLYLSWMAIWWVRHTRHERQPHGQLLEG
jgi:predicted anti-sigma-YlaC factor YlaD